MRLDDILEEIGGFGRYQKWVFLLTCPPNLLAGFFMINPVFLLGVPNHRCALPTDVYNNDSYEVQNEVHRQLINQYIPNSTVHGDKELYDRCHLFVTSAARNNGSVSTNSMQTNEEDARPEETCARWVYDDTVFESTFVTQMDLVCSKEIMVANAEMIFYGGMLVGSLASGIFADRYGRKPVMYISLLLMIGSSIGLPWAHAYWLFVIIEFILGASVISTFMPAYIISLELTSAKKRVWPGVISDFPYVIGLVLLSVIAYFLRDWFKIQLYTSIPCVLFISYWWLMPESPRWLLTKGRVKEAEIIIRRAAKWNKVTLPEKLFDSKTLDDDQDASSSILQLFSSKTLCVRSLVVFFNWTVVALAYFGLALNSDNLAGNVYLNFGLSGLVEVPAYFIVIALVDKIGRRRMYCGSMITGGIACASTILAIEYEPEGSDILTVALAMIGKLCVTAAYSVAYIHTAELYPTVIRNAGLGVASVFARVGTMAAPYIVVLGEELGGTWGEALPLVVFGGMSFVSGVLSLLLPETLNKHLPETLEDGERFGRSGAFYFVRSLRLHHDGSDTKYDCESEHELLLSTESHTLK